MDLETGHGRRFSDDQTNLAASITREASKQTYYTIRFLVDRALIPYAYRAYAYFRWVDDSLDQRIATREERLAFVERQQALIDSGYNGWRLSDLAREELLLADLIAADQGPNSGLQAYIRNMMAVMAFDANRRGRLISQMELAEYSRALGTAVTEALHYFIGHDAFSPQNEARYLAATAAHITHMLRDTIEDTAAGYYNIPHDYLNANGITPWDMQTDAYRAWVQSRVELARSYFGQGKRYLTQVENRRCRMAGYTYIARFEPVLDAIEASDYRLWVRVTEPERKLLTVGIAYGWSAFRIGGRRQQAPLSRPATAR